MGFLDDLFGRKPTVPELPQVSLTEEQRKAAEANIAIAPKGAELADLSMAQINKMMESAIPGFGGIQKQAAGNITSLLRGEIPMDVSQEVKRQGAGRALTGGYAGTDAAERLVARDLGLTSLGVTREGLSSAESWISSMERLYSPSQALFSSMFITPQQEFAAATQERNLQFQRDWLSNQIAAMPDPTTVGLWNASWSVVDAVLSAYTGSNVDLGRVNPQGSFGGPSQMNFGGGGSGMGWGGPGGAYGWQSAPVGAMGGGTGALGGGGSIPLGGFE